MPYLAATAVMAILCPSPQIGAMLGCIAAQLAQETVKIAAGQV
jgi:hypothetical protein